MFIYSACPGILFEVASSLVCTCGLDADLSWLKMCMSCTMNCFLLLCLVENSLFSGSCILPSSHFIYLSFSEPFSITLSCLLDFVEDTLSCLLGFVEDSMYVLV